MSGLNNFFRYHFKQSWLINGFANDVPSTFVITCQENLPHYSICTMYLDDDKARKA